MKDLKTYYPSLIMFVFCYLAGSFCEASFNLYEWHIETRFIFGSIGLFLAFLSLLLISIKNS